MTTAIDFDALEPLLSDPTIRIITINRYDNIYFSREAFRMEKAAQTFRDEATLRNIVNQLLAMHGQALSASAPICTIVLSDYSRITIVDQPVAANGLSMTIQKPVPPSEMPTWETLLRAGSLSAEMHAFLSACAQGKVNIAVCGATGSGKTTLLTLIANMIPTQRRLVTGEEDFWLNLTHDNRFHMHTSPTVNMRQVLETALHMRPDHIICAEVHGAEALTMLEAMQNGYEGSMFAIHATSPRDCVGRLEIMLTEAAPTLPLTSLRQKIASGLDLIVQIDILADGWRRLVKISALNGMVGDVVELVDLYTFVETGKDAEGKISGRYEASGYVPRFANRLASYGITLP
ncbi:MAG: CpaF family protein [Chloroflexi bacterium CFX4]|nr:CpaF family protein [Chloroflexi bacterium CFX4]MDL1922865.1 CpaF family protein [Chloroflexi bacterium CFX3]